jgi:hypothetical protein
MSMKKKKKVTKKQRRGQESELTAKGILMERHAPEFGIPWGCKSIKSYRFSS